MPVKINGQAYYRTAEVCLMVGIGKSTLFRWIKEGIMEDAERRDRRGWRLFTEDEVNRVKTEVNGIRRNHVAEMLCEPEVSQR